MTDLEFFDNDELRIDVWKGKYALHNTNNVQVEQNPTETIERVAKALASVNENPETQFQIYKERINNFKNIVPQGSVLAGAGNHYQIMSLSNCVVLPSPDDSIYGIGKSVTDMAQLMKRRCVEVNTIVYVENRGAIPISRVDIGDKILSFDIETKSTVYRTVLDKFKSDVEKDDRIKITFQNGTILKTSKKHPILTWKDGVLFYQNAGDLDVSDIGISIGTNILEEYGYVNDMKLDIESRIPIKSIEVDNESIEYIDIEVEGTNNFFAGNFGFVNIHNCGVGIDLSSLRPKNALVNNASRTSTGACGWANIFSDMTRAVGQGGRRGALMLTLNIDHPDAEEWCLMKQDLSKVTGANVSLKLNDKFMQAVEKDELFIQRFKDKTGKILLEKKINARNLWNTIIKCAWQSGEPGLLMWDNIISTLPAHCYDEFKTIGTNPCSEIPLSPNDSCRLITICLSFYVKEEFTQNAYFDFEQFEKDVRIATQMSDDLVELELQHVQEIINNTINPDEKELWQKFYDAGYNGRRTGLGTHGLADCLIYLGIRYDSDEAIEFADKIYSLFCHTAYDESVELAIRRGPFPLWNWEKEKTCKFFKHFPKTLLDKMQKHGRRNVSMLTMAPTGSVSMMSGTSSGIEPNFRHYYTRRRKINHNDPSVRVDFIDNLGDKWQEYPILSYSTKAYAKHFNIAIDDIVNGKHKLPKYFVMSDEIDYHKRVQIQGVIQKYIDHGISSTINVPSNIQSEAIGEIYIEAWKHGLKGITVYRDGCRTGVLVTKKQDNVEKRPEILPCDIHQIRARGENWIAMVGLYNDRPIEIFSGRAENIEIPIEYKKGIIVKKKGSYWLHFNDKMKLNIKTCFEDVEGDLTRLVSLLLRSNVPMESIVAQLDKVKGNITDLSHAIKRVLKTYITDTTKIKCSECGMNTIVMEDGCFMCKNCGNTKCG